ncbi:lipoyl(octanoyl) transferase LipB [Planctomycetota bacterium]
MMDSVIQIQVREAKNEHSVQVCDCGLVDYREMLQKQIKLCKKRQQGTIPNTILLVEHPSVITLGARQNRNKMLVSRSDLERKNIDIVNIRRGGGTTAHNPGQLVIYPILHLQQLGLCIREYIRKLETIGAELLSHLGVKSTGNDCNPGLWIQKKKIASIGVRVSRFTTYHGMAVNIQNDLNIFEYIVPCGLDNVEMTSILKETGKCHSMTEVKKLLTPLLRTHFSDSR